MSDPIRILHVIGIMNRGGAETMIMNLYRHIDRAKIQFDFVENSDKPAAYDDEITALGGRIYRCPHYNGRNHFSYIDWWKRFFGDHAGEFAAVHGHLGSTAAIYLRIAKKHGLYTIAHSHNTSIATFRNALYNIYAYPTRFLADYFFGCSLAAGISRFGKKVCADPERFSVLRNAIDTKRFSFDPEKRAEIRKQYSLEEKLVVGHVGRFAAQKNHGFLIKVFARIHSVEPRAVLMLVGDGELRPKIEEQIQGLDLAESVIFTGVHADVSALYQAMDVFLFPSLYEGLPLVMVEEQCSGLPAVISVGITEECIIAESIVVKLSLRDSAEMWADRALQCASLIRSDHAGDAVKSGFDIRETSRWMEHFYLGIAGRSDG